MSAHDNKKLPKQDQFIGRQGIAARLSMSVDSVDRYVAPNIARVPVGRRVLFRVRDVDDWIERQVKGPVKGPTR